MEQTTEKRGGRGKNPIPVGKKFSKDYQPAGRRKSDGKQKKKFARHVLKEMLNLPYKFATDSPIKKSLINAFGEGIELMSVAEVMSLQQMQKAVLKGDTQAYSTLLDQALGRNQSIDLSSLGESMAPQPYKGKTEEELKEMLDAILKKLD